MRAAPRQHVGSRVRGRARARALTWLCGAALLLAFGLRGLLLGPGGLQRLLFGPVRTHPSLLLQHYNARELLFRRHGKRVYFLHIHKVRARSAARSQSAAPHRRLRRLRAARCASWRRTRASW